MTPMMAAVLANLLSGRLPDHGFAGEYSASLSTRALKKRHWINARGKITEDGKSALTKYLKKYGPPLRFSSLFEGLKLEEKEVVTAHSNDCIVCDYSKGSSEEAMGLLAILGEASKVVTDAIAVGIGTGLMMATLPKRAQVKMLACMCSEHRAAVKMASKPITSKDG